MITKNNNVNNKIQNIKNLMIKMTDFYANSCFRKYNRKSRTSVENGSIYMPHIIQITIIFWISYIFSYNVKIVSCITYYLYDMYIYIT